MAGHHPRSTRTVTLCPYPRLFRGGRGVDRRRGGGRGAGRVPRPVAEGDAGMTMTMSASAPGAGAGSPLWLRGGYRVLFGCGALWAASVVTLWVGALDGRWTLPTAVDPLAWHQQEMLLDRKSVVSGTRGSGRVDLGGRGAH